MAAKQTQQQKQNINRRHFHGFSENVRNELKGLKGSKMIVAAKTLVEQKKLVFIYLSESDLALPTDDKKSTIGKQLGVCLLSIHENLKEEGTGWCERNVKPFFQKNAAGKIIQYCTTKDAVGILWAKDVIKNKKYNSVCLGILTNETLTPDEAKDIFLSEMKKMNLSILTHWFADNIIGYALLTTPYKVKGVSDSIYIVLTCTSQDATVSYPEGEKMVVGTGPVMFNVISGYAYDLGYKLVSLRAATALLINVYIPYGFHRSLNGRQKRSKDGKPLGNKVDFSVYRCDDPTKTTIILDKWINESTDTLRDVDTDIGNDGYFMTRLSEPSPY